MTGKLRKVELLQEFRKPLTIPVLFCSVLTADWGHGSVCFNGNLRERIGGEGDSEACYDKKNQLIVHFLTAGFSYVKPSDPLIPGEEIPLTSLSIGSIPAATIDVSLEDSLL